MCLIVALDLESVLIMILRLVLLSMTQKRRDFLYLTGLRKSDATLQIACEIVASAAYAHCCTPNRLAKALQAVPFRK